jgi:hypothetical protein
LVIRAVEHQSIWCSQPLSLACSINDTVNDALLYLRLYLNGWLPDQDNASRSFRLRARAPSSLRLDPRDGSILGMAGNDDAGSVRRSERTF